jgi:6-phosphofructokinase 1
MNKSVFFSYSEDDIKGNEGIRILLGRIKDQLSKYSIRYYDYKEICFPQSNVAEYLNESIVAIIIINKEQSNGVNAEIEQINNMDEISPIYITSESFETLRKQTAGSRIELSALLKKTNTTIIIGKKNIEKNVTEIISSILNRFNIHLPQLSYLASYEKDIISIYKRKILNISTDDDKELFGKGFPPEWPRIQINSHFNILETNPLIEENENEGTDKKRRWKDSEKDRVFSAALTSYFPEKCEPGQNTFCLSKNNLSFPEAGLRQEIRDFFDTNQSKRSLPDRNKIGIVVSGGIAPGINAVIHAIVQRHWTYYNILKDSVLFEYNQNKTCLTAIMGFKHGFSGLYSWIKRPGDKWDNIEANSDYEYLFDTSEQRDRDQHIIRLRLKSKITSRYIDEAGSLIPTSRAKEFLISENQIEKIEKIVKGLVKDNIKILYIIGGDGSMRFAHQLATYAIRTNADVSIVTIPKTMDNDILWVWKPFGFESAVIKASEVINQISWEIKSNPKLGIVQLFGSFSGFVAGHAILGSKAQNCDLVIIPELKFNIDKVWKLVKNSLQKHRQSLLIISQCAFPDDLSKHIRIKNLDGTNCITNGEKKSLLDANEIYQNDKKNGLRNIYGATKDYDEWSSPLLKLLKAVLEKKAVEPIRKEGIVLGRTITNKPQHVVRAIPPSPIDIIHAERLGFLAVDSAMAGCTDFMISQWLTEFCLVPLTLVTLGGKRLPVDGTFWKSVTSRTGQNPNLM